MKKSDVDVVWMMSTLVEEEGEKRSMQMRSECLHGKGKAGRKGVGLDGKGTQEQKDSPG